MIIKEIGESDFVKAFEDYNRAENFTIEGRRALFEYLDDLHTAENPLELDIIALCCEFSEYYNIGQYLKDYSTEVNKDDYEEIEDFCAAIEDEISDNTTLIKLGDELNEGFIIQSY